MKKIIDANLLFNHMDQHNWASMGKDQLKGFEEELDLTNLNNYAIGYLDALEDAIWALTEKRTKVLKIVKLCCSCRWWADSDEVCCCEQSEYCARFTQKYTTCQYWEKDKML